MTFVRFIPLAITTASGFTSCREVVPPQPLPVAPEPERRIQLGKVTAVSVADFFVLQQSESVLTLDARPGFYFNLGHIPGAIHLPKSDFSARFPKREKEIKAALAAGKTIVIYCTDLQCPDARALATRLAQSGYSSSVLTGGWAAWKESGLLVE
jgi:rhodanese-related sulfurtransferase